MSVNFDLDMTDEEYVDILNNTFPPVKICGITFDAGAVLLKMDPVAFRVGKHSYQLDVICEYESNSGENDE